eukprot:3495927-Pyramimonas_sp.AAC.2
MLLHFTGPPVPITARVLSTPQKWAREYASRASVDSDGSPPGTASRSRYASWRQNLAPVSTLGARTFFGTTSASEAGAAAASRRCGGSQPRERAGYPHIPESSRPISREGGGRVWHPNVWSGAGSREGKGVGLERCRDQSPFGPSVRPRAPSLA